MVGTCHLGFRKMCVGPSTSGKGWTLAITELEAGRSWAEDTYNDELHPVAEAPKDERPYKYHLEW